MSVEAQMSVAPAVNGRGFTVEYQLSCVIVRGALLIDEITAILGTVSKDAVMSVQLSQRFGATFVAGLPEDLAKLAEIAPLRPLRAGSERLPTDAIAWLQKGERGSSSESMFDAVFGGHFAASHEHTAATPGDVSDFVRCRLLVEQVATVASHLDRVAEISPIWRRLVEAWPLLCETLDREVANYRAGDYAAPETDALIESLCWGNKS